MNAEEIRNYCLTKAGITEGFPFGESALVFKVAGKIFALLLLDTYPLKINLKCAPSLAVELREKYPCVLPGYHMNKKHWNTVVVDGSVSGEMLCSWIDHSYDRVVMKMPKKLRATLNQKI